MTYAKKNLQQESKDQIENEGAESLKTQTTAEGKGNDDTDDKEQKDKDDESSGKTTNINTQIIQTSQISQVPRTMSYPPRKT